MRSIWVGSQVHTGLEAQWIKKVPVGIVSVLDQEWPHGAAGNRGKVYGSKHSFETIWLRKLLLNLLKKRMGSTEIMCDNQSCIKLSENPVFHDWSKHIDIRCHFIRDYVQRGAVQLRHTFIGEQVADILTKALSKIKFTYFRENMGMVENAFQ